MGGHGRYVTGDENNLAKMIADLSKRVSDLESGNRIGATAVDKGALNVSSGAFTVGDVLYFGEVNIGGPTPGWIFRRADGTVVFTLGGSAANDQFWALWDNGGNIVISDDGAADQGLARPWLPIPWVSSVSVAPADTTTSGSFTALLSTRVIKQHPKLYAMVLVLASDGTTTGEIQIARANGGVVVDGPTTVSAGFYGIINLTGDIPGEHMEEVELEVQARRTAGAGTIGVRMFGCYSRQS